MTKDKELAHKVHQIGDHCLGAAHGEWLKAFGSGVHSLELGVRIRGTLGDTDPLNKVPF